jgi:D-galacturonate reductase
MNKLSVLMVGSGEYTTGYVPGANAAADKKAGVIAITLFDLRRRGQVERLLMAGTNGSKFPEIRRHLVKSIGEVYRDMDVQFDSYPADDVAAAPTAYRSALDSMKAGDAVLVFTPDDTHFAIALDAIERGCHVLVAKPLVKTLEEHRKLVDAADRAGVLLAMEVHKRWDPMYTDACDRIRQLGDFSFFQAYMSQPKSQLRTFQAWAGKSSDISYYLNAHHIDFHTWACSLIARPISVCASAATGVATGLGMATEDTITLLVDWENITSRTRGTGVYTASWIAPTADVHSQQRFHYMGHRGEISIDQAHRGYSVATDANGFLSANPLFMKYAPDSQGYFVGQQGYGYRSIEMFLQAAVSIRRGASRPGDYALTLATGAGTLGVTAILEAGRRSLDSAGRPWRIEYKDGQVNGLVPD